MLEVFRTAGGSVLPLLLIALLSAVTGCDALLGIFAPSTVTITLENGSSSFTVDGTLIYDDMDHFLTADLSALGTKRDFDLDPGERFSFPPLDCDDVETLMIEDADLRVFLGVSPETSTGVLRIGDDYHCGDEIVFTFSGGTDFDVSVTSR